MRFLFSIALITAVANFATGQNLVPNPSFETVTNCSPTVNVLNCPPWFTPTNGSPDNFNQCFSPWALQVPANNFGFQYPRTGMGYSGIIPYDNFNRREYLEVQLSDSLISGKKYCVEFYVSLGNGSMYAIDALGAFFSHDSILDSSGNYPILSSYIPNVSNPTNNIIADTSGWILISGLYIATGGERFITIGDFISNPNTSMVNSNGIGSYYYIEDVSVVDCGWSGINEQNRFTNVLLYPNPSSDGNFTLTFELAKENNVQIDILSLDGQIVYSNSIVCQANSHTELPVRLDEISAAGGMYILQARTSDAVIRKKLLVLRSK